MCKPRKDSKAKRSAEENYSQIKELPLGNLVSEGRESDALPEIDLSLIYGDSTAAYEVHEAVIADQGELFGDEKLLQDVNLYLKGISTETFDVENEDGLNEEGSNESGE